MHRKTCSGSGVFFEYLEMKSVMLFHGVHRSELMLMAQETQCWRIMESGWGSGFDMLPFPQHFLHMIELLQQVVMIRILDWSCCECATGVVDAGRCINAE
jgi:hypothetical protein